MEIIIAGLILATLGLLFGISLGFAYKFFSVNTDERLDKILQLLAGANCGACGKASCEAFAQALLNQELDINTCKVTTEEAKNKISKILNREFKKSKKLVAVLHCNGGDRVKDRFIYDGLKTCSCANLVLGGQKACIWGCLGFGDCIKVCPVSAITMSSSKIPKVDINKCIGCGRCVEVCPKKLFSLIELEYRFYIACSSHDSPQQTKEVCKVGCIACGICTKVAPSVFYLEENLSYIDYDKIDKLEPLEEAKNKCPVKCILKL